ncbi:MAG: hypothetical protein AB7O39_13655 [Flavobacteriaceae bacterium]
MNKLSRFFFGFALLYGLVGIGLGLYMASSHSHIQTPTHAHVQLLGWVSFALFGFFYHQFPAAAAGIMAKAHAVLAILSSIVMLVTLFMLYAGNLAVEPILAIASIVYGVSYLAFIAAMAPVIARG